MVMANINHLGEAQVYQCSACKERYIGGDPKRDKDLASWLKAHRKNHIWTSRGYCYPE